MFNFFRGRKIAQELYGRNLELATKNKTLSLLEKLYQTSIKTLAPEEMAAAVTGIIRHDLNLEFAGILAFNKKADTLASLGFSHSAHLAETLAKVKFFFENLHIDQASKNRFFSRALVNKSENITGAVEEIFTGPLGASHAALIKKESHIKTVLLYPLIMGNEVLGVLLLGLNRNYDTLNHFEKTSIKSFINVIALVLDKAYLYQNLQASYEVTKKAYAVEKKANEELERLDKFKDQFLMTTQHNLRTPLTSMMGYTDLLLKGMFGKQTKKTTEVIQKFQTLTHGMIKMVNDFLDIAQFQLGKSVVTLKPGVEILPMLDEIITELEFKAQSKDVALSFTKPDHQIVISADREKLKAALFNIIDNAIKYTPKGSVTVQIQNHDAVKIVVSDTGIGIPKEKLPTLFETMFERGAEAKKIAATGSGIGLYLSAQIIKAHNGKVWVESEGEGKGSVFHVELPLG